MRRTALSLIGSSVAVAATGCAGSGTDGSGAESGQKTFTMAAFPTGNSLDPWKTQLSQYVAAATYDTLTHLDADGTVVPWLATSWEYSDATTLVMELRTDVVFTDGARFDAEAVKANIEYAKEVTPSNVAAQPYLAYVRSVDAVSKNKVRFNLTSAQPDLPYGFSQQAGWMVSPTALKNPGTLADTAVGSGPYVLDKSGTTPNKTYTFSRNKKYWATEAKWPLFDKLVVQLMTELTASDNAARSGQIDYTIVAAGTEISGWKIAQGAACAFFGFTVFDTAGKINKALGDVRVRQAMNYAIDRQAILKSVLRGQGETNASAPFGSDSLGYSRKIEDFYSYDVAKAKRLLRQAGYPDGFSVKVLNNPQWDQLAQALAGYLRKVGIDVQLSNHGDDFVQQTNSGKWAMATCLQTVTGFPFSDFTFLMTKNSSMNPLGNSNATVNNLLAKAVSAEGDEQKRRYAQLAETAAEQAWYVVPALSSQLHAYDPKVVEVTEPDRAGAPMLHHLRPAGAE
ncbi:ABC transporter substrate-binding protein [Streptomyces sp. NPDC058321]|uniref:ABC transporter substrate-binding protein n=1 Tax=Streptomyces sp. NPDC058321 TaxID=3346445 RepID=UPI0036EC7B5E